MAASVDVTKEGSFNVTIHEIVCECGERIDIASLDADRDGDLIVTIGEHECIQSEKD